MEIKDFKIKLGELIDYDQQEKSLIDQIESEAVRLALSNGIDLKEMDNDFLPVKVCLYVAMKNVAEEYRPLSAYKDLVDNLSHY